MEKFILEELRKAIAQELKNYVVSDELSNANGREHNELFQVRLNDNWEGDKYDFHYEIQQNRKNPNIFYMRIDCHFYPYGESKNLSKSAFEDKYGIAEVQKRLSIMREMRKKLNYNNEYIEMPSLRYNALCIAKWNLSDYCHTFEEAKTEIKSIIAVTYSVVDDIIKNTIRFASLPL